MTAFMSGKDAFMPKPTPSHRCNRARARLRARLANSIQPARFAKPAQKQTQPAQGSLLFRLARPILLRGILSDFSVIMAEKEG